MTEAEFRAGQHEQAIASLAADMRTVKIDISEIKNILARRQGGREATKWIGHVLSAIIGAVAALASTFFGRHA